LNGLKSLVDTMKTPAGAGMSTVLDLGHTGGVLIRVKGGAQILVREDPHRRNIGLDREDRGPDLGLALPV
jgi:hypothetical protein